MAGESAEREYARRSASRRERVRRSWPRNIALIVAAFAVGWVFSIVFASVAMSMVESVVSGTRTMSVHTPPPIVSVLLATALAVSAARTLLGPSRAEVAWRKGAEGERVVGRALDALTDEDAQLLHDRLIPGSRANIDHVAIAPGGVFTVDAKRYTGKLEVRARGREIWIKGRNRSKLLDQARRQAEVVSTVLARAGFTEVPVKPVLCFVGTEMPGLLGPKQAGGVLLTSHRRVRKRLLAAGTAGLAPTQIATIAEALDSALIPADQPPASPTDEQARGAETPTRTSTSHGPPPQPEGPGPPSPTCDRCRQPMVLRTRRSNGTRFYGCSTYPRCRSTQPVDG